MSINRIANKKLDDEFEVDGLWWLPNDPDNKIPGTLFFKRNEIKLKLMGGFRNENGLQEFLSYSTTPFEIIYGESNHDEKITLIEADSSGGITSLNGFKSEVYDINSFITGGYFEDKNNISFYSCTIFPTYLTTWLDKRPISLEWFEPEKGSRIRNFAARFNETNTFNYSIDSLEAEIEETNIFNNKLDNNRDNLHWEFTSGLSLIAANKKLSWFKNKNKELINFLSILIGEGVYFQRINFKGDFEETQSSKIKTEPRRENYYYFIKQYDYKNKNKFSNNDILISFKEIEEEFPLLLDNWFKKTEELNEIYKLYFGILYSNVVYIENTLLSTIQILEIYHRNRYEGKVFDEETFKIEKEKIKRFSRKHLDQEVHKKLMESIAHANDYSLKMRLLELINSFSDNTKLALIGDTQDVKKFIKQLVDTRNYLAHYDPERKPNLLVNIDERFYGIQRLKAIVTMILFIDLGMDEEFVINKIKDSQHFSYSLAKAKEILNS